MKLFSASALFTLTVVALRAQGPQAPPAFKSVVIRNSSGVLSTTRPPDNTYGADNVSLGMLIRRAYGISQPEMSGGPDWLENYRYDVRGEYEPGTTEADQRAMLQTLLADRFQLRVHHESRTMQVYDLIVLKPGELGAWLAPTTRDCSKEPPPDLREMMRNMDVGCGTVVSFPPGPPHRVSAISRDFSTIVDVLNMIGHINGPVLDRTGLTGKFDFDLAWTPAPDQYPVQPPGLPGPEFGTPIALAVQSQLGLKLEAHDGPVDVLVIDNAEKPDVKAR